MLDAITDFWKPVKKSASQNKPKISELQVGSTIEFGFVPQVALSARNLKVTGINSYQFGTEVLTSFVLSQEKEPDVSMIIADAQGEQYLAISRRISVSDRIKLFDENSIEDIVAKTEVSKLTCKDNLPEFKGWVVANYKREIQGMSGRIYKKDVRKGAGNDSGEEFKYTLLVSESNEHAIEIEKYSDGRIDVYATVYRRMNDVSDVKNPSDTTRADVKLVAKEDEAVTPVIAPQAAPVLSAFTVKTEAPKAEEKPEEKIEVKAEEKTEEKKPEPETVKLESFALPELKATPLAPEIEKPELEPVTLAAPEPKAPEEKKDMASIEAIAKPATNNGYGSNFGTSPVVTNAYVAPLTTAETKPQQETQTVTKTAADNESIACELHVANQIIEEAIRQEMRLSDVIRRVVALPVADKQEVHIPLTLSDDDYALLAIRYNLPAADKNAIKARIIEDLNDFTGSKKPQFKAA